MLTARRHNLTEPTQNVWYTVDLFNASYFGHGAWQRGDQYDLDAYEAYKGTFVLFVSLSNHGGGVPHIFKIEKSFCYYLWYKTAIYIKSVSLVI